MIFGSQLKNIFIDIRNTFPITTTLPTIKKKSAVLVPIVVLNNFLR